MSQNNKTVYVISGANRGIGFAFVETFSKRPNHVIYAGARMPEEAKALHELSQSRPGSIKIVKLDSGSEKDMQAIASQIEAEEGHADVVIANAGITIHEAQAKTLDVKYEYIREHIEVNTFGPLYLYRAMYPVLQKANKGAKFITISSRLGSNGCMEDFPMDTSAYGVSKAAINFLLRKTHFETEEEGFVVFPICPNWVNTEMGNGSATKAGLTEAPTKLEDSVGGMVKVFDTAKRDTHGGKFWTEAGVDVPF